MVRGILNGSIADAETEEYQVPVAPAGEANFFEYQEVWNSVTPSSGGAGGGHAVTIHGRGFDSVTELEQVGFQVDAVATIQREYRVTLSNSSSQQVDRHSQNVHSSLNLLWHMPTDF